MEHHNPLRFAQSLGAKLATRSRHVCALLGAGVGKACGLPDVAELQGCISESLSEQEQEVFAALSEHRHLEAVLSRLRRISSLIDGSTTVDGLTSEAAEALDGAVCRAIVSELTVDDQDLTPVRCLAAWAARANYHSPVELFTVNYDLLLEIALDRMRVPYFDGFVGTVEARFHTELVEEWPGVQTGALPPFFVRLWKLHGSINWAWTENRHVARFGRAVPGTLPAAIYPSDSKYEESRRVPFVVLHDRLRRALREPETLLLITGYSFGDEHINEHIYEAATHCPRSEFIAFCYSTIPDELAERAKITPNLQVVSAKEAILAGARRAWRGSDDSPSDIWDGNRFALHDFTSLARYLARSTTREHTADHTLKRLLEESYDHPSTTTRLIEP